MKQLLAVGIVALAMIGFVSFCSMPFFLLGLLWRGRARDARVRRGSRQSVKDEVVRAQWEYDQLWNRRK